MFRQQMWKGRAEEEEEEEEEEFQVYSWIEGPSLMMMSLR